MATTIQATELTSPWAISKGLMFTTRPRTVVFSFKDEAVRPITMFFVWFSLDLIFLDKDKKIVEKATIPPFSVYTPKKKAQYVVEMAELAGQNLKMGESVQWKSGV